MADDVMPWRGRVTQALAVLRGAKADAGTVATAAAEAQQERAVIDVTYPSLGIGQAALVRTANPQEYKPDGATVRAQGFNRHPVVHACIRVVADIVASVPLVVLSAKGDMETRVPESHPLQRLLDYPGPRMTARGMRSRYAVDFIGYGNAFFQLERPSPGRPPVGIRAINAESIQTVWVDADGDARRYDYGNWSGIVVQVPVEDVLHFRDLDMPRPFTPDVFGFPRGATAIASMTADNEATQYVRQVVTNDGTPTFAVLLSDQASQDDALAMQDRYRARVVDRGKRGTPAFFGAVRDIKPLGFTLSDLEFPSLRKVSREDICAAYGVDPRMIGIASATSDAGLSGAQYAEARARLVQHTIEPMLSAIEDELNNWLAPEFGDVWITYDRDVLRELTENDTETSARVRAEWKDSLRTWEEARRAIGLSPTPEPTDTIAMTTGTQLVPAATAVIDPRAIRDVVDIGADTAPSNLGPELTPAQDAADAEGDALAGRRTRSLADMALSGDQIEALLELLESVVEQELPPDAVKAVLLAAFPSMDTALIGQMVDAVTGFTPAPGEEEPAEPGEDAPEEEMAAAKDAWWMRLTPEELAVEPRYMLWRAAMDVLTQREGGFYDEAMAEFHVEREKVGAMFGVGTRARKTKEQILDEIARRIAEDYAPGGEYYAAWRDRFLKLIGDMYMTGARQAGGVGLSFSLESPEVLAAITKRSSTLAGLVGDTTSKQILSAMRAGELGGFSIAEIGRLVQASVFNEPVTEGRARTIARTESAGAMSQGNWDQARAMGDLYQSKEWLAFEDDKTRETHTACMAQGRIPFGDRFSNGLDYPLDPAGSAAEVINCRCVLAYYDTTVEEQPR